MPDPVPHPPAQGPTHGLAHALPPTHGHGPMRLVIDIEGDYRIVGNAHDAHSEGTPRANGPYRAQDAL
jgi:hypothetical protein